MPHAHVRARSGPQAPAGHCNLPQSARAEASDRPRRRGPGECQGALECVCREKPAAEECR
eukprot:14984741-Alexandrium_andersonii.AAC.1